jgi:hypothetical protein
MAIPDTPEFAFGNESCSNCKRGCCCRQDNGDCEQEDVTLLIGIFSLSSLSCCERCSLEGLLAAEYVKEQAVDGRDISETDPE